MPRQLVLKNVLQFVECRSLSRPGQVRVGVWRKGIPASLILAFHIARDVHEGREEFEYLRHSWSAPLYR
ncbi:hypothetical protein [Aurantiacibacter marinus]|uniref:hypothetical protein n=1 Tax=Aurantiacibacter marinus TaxID=874156 RepID=UPI00138DFE25|nr:hypothetical protein [Aurantiacibacter marinus]